MNALLEFMDDNMDPNTLNRNLCQLLDQSINCMRGAEEPAAEVAPTNASTTDSCPQTWAYFKCWPATPFNTTNRRPCSQSMTSELDGYVTVFINLFQSKAYFGTEEIFVTHSVSAKNASNDGEISLHCNATTRGWNPKWSEMTCLLKLTALDTDDSVALASSVPDFSANGTANATEHDFGESTHQQTTDFMSGYNALLKFTMVGHAISLTSLLFALFLFAFLRRLHCTRIYIHMNLMASFTLRGLIWILQTTAFRDSNTVEDVADMNSVELVAHLRGPYLVSDLPKLEGYRKQYCVAVDDNQYVWSNVENQLFSNVFLLDLKIWCRIYYVCLNYLVLANYFWLLVEGLYLQLLLRAVAFSNKKYLRGFLVLGWVLPALLVFGGVLAKSLDPNENRSCWFREKDNQYWWWIIKLPILVSLLINFVVFMVVIRVVGSKLKRSQQHHRVSSTREDYRWRLAKSTLSLIPLLGIQYMVTAFVGIAIKDAKTRFALAAFDLSFVSIQGFLVALIYCFLNAEVQEECQKTWRWWKTRWELERRDFYRLRELKRKRSGSGMTSSVPATCNSYLARKASAGYSVSESANQNGGPERLRLTSERSDAYDSSPTQRHRLRSTNLNLSRRPSAIREVYQGKTDTSLDLVTTRLLGDNELSLDNRDDVESQSNGSGRRETAVIGLNSKCANQDDPRCPLTILSCPSVTSQSECKAPFTPDGATFDNSTVTSDDSSPKDSEPSGEEVASTNVTNTTKEGIRGTATSRELQATIDNYESIDFVCV